MPAKTAKPTLLAAAFAMAALSFSTAAPAAADTAAQFEPFETAQTHGMDNRQDRRGDRQDDRADRRTDRQDCRQAEGAGADKRHCKQGERQDRNMNG